MEIKNQFEVRKVPLLLISLILVIFFASGCQVIDRVAEAYEKFDTRAQRREAAGIIDAVRENDIQGIKELLCTKTREKNDIDEEIQKFIDFVEGDILSYDESIRIHSEEYGVGAQSDYHKYRWTVEDIRTDAGITYEMNITEYSVNEKEPGLQGILKLNFRDENGNSFTLGEDESAG